MTTQARYKKPEPALNRSFLLRVWQTSQHGFARASLTDVDTTEVLVFADLEELSRWLEVNCEFRKDLRSQKGD